MSKTEESGANQPGSASHAPAPEASASAHASVRLEAEARRQALIIATSPSEPEDQAFVDSISIFDELAEESPGG